MIHSFNIIHFRKTACLLLFGLFFSDYALANTDCFVASENNVIIKQEGSCHNQFPPCSTFKIAISLMGYDSGILIDAKNPTWDYQPGYIDWLEKWKQPHNPSLWFTNSCVWYSQVVTKQLGMPRFSAYIAALTYGNEDVSGDKGKDNGLTNSWLSSSLAISPIEQMNFLQQLTQNRLPVSLHAQQMTRNIMFVENLPDGWKLYGKTGNCSQLSHDKSEKLDKQTGWFVGFVTKDDRTITFAYLIADDKKQDSYASLRAKAALKAALPPLLQSD